MNAASKPRFPRAEALAVVRVLLPVLLPACAPGGKENNTQIALAAQERGLKWHPYHGGFEVRNGDLARVILEDEGLYTGKLIAARTEEDVYRLAGLPFLPPNRRL